MRGFVSHARARRETRVARAGDSLPMDRPQQGRDLVAKPAAGADRRVGFAESGHRLAVRRADDTEPPASGRTADRTEDDGGPLIEEPPPVARMRAHDLRFGGVHVRHEGGAWRQEAAKEVARSVRRGRGESSEPPEDALPAVAVTATRVDPLAE